MALVACEECKKEISSEATSCPHCGKKVVRTSGCAKFALVIVGFFVVALIIGNQQKRGAENDEAARVAALTPEQRETERRRAEITKQAEAKKELAFQKVVAALRAIRDANRNPSSVSWISVGANGDASVICVEFRGQNGFGGMSKEFVVIANGTASKKPAAWNKHCAGQPLNDMISARQAL